MPIAYNVALLAAGSSSRLGQPKQLLLKHHQPLINYCIDLIMQLNAHSIQVIINPYFEYLKQAYPSVNFRINERYQSGMASSIQSIDVTCNVPTLLLVVDQPLLTLADLNQFIDYLHLYPRANIVSEYHQTIGIPALVQHDILMQSHSLSHDQGLKQLLLQDKKRICLAMPHLGFDIDTPADLKFAQSQGWLER